MNRGDTFRARSDCSVLGIELMQGDIMIVEDIDYEERALDVRILLGGFEGFEMWAGGRLVAADLVTIEDRMRLVGHTTDSGLTTLRDAPHTVVNVDL